ncbi:hypothetical protein ACWGF3_37900 [Streptomyces xanthophaeus]|uniref:hypothetical protein n=1 Tax=Streptomyces xanthophaeus TaxID=67385 RepID=UPI0004CCC0A7|nr:hypothetical protein [Streptomyces xanthophaeus]
MPVPPLSPQGAAESAMRAGLALGSDRHAAVAATAHHVLGVISRLRELDLAETPPAAAYRADSQGR